MPEVFISYSSRDRHFARSLRTRLEEEGATIWLAEQKLRVGDSLQDKIAEAIGRCDYFLAVLSNNSVQSVWVQQELKQAINIEMEDGRKKVLPILLSDCEIPHFLKERVYADFRDAETIEKTWSLLIQSLGLEAHAASAKEETTGTCRLSNTLTLVHAESQLEDFDDIRIVEIDKAKCYQPDRAKLLWNIYFRLSTPPPLTWVEIFEAERKFPRHMRWRRAWIEDNYIVMYCLPDEVKKYHRIDLTEDTRATNDKYRKYMLDEQEKVMATHILEDTAQRMLDDNLDGIEF